MLFLDSAHQNGLKSVKKLSTVSLLLTSIIITSQTAIPTGKASSYESKGTSRESKPLGKENKRKEQIGNNKKINYLRLFNKRH